MLLTVRPDLAVSTRVPMSELPSRIELFQIVNAVHFVGKGISADGGASTSTLNCHTEISPLKSRRQPQTEIREAPSRFEFRPRAKLKSKINRPDAHARRNLR